MNRPARIAFGIVVLLAGVSTIGVGRARAQTPPPCVADGSLTATNAPDTLGFADHLFSLGQYYRAITEYERYLYAQSGVPAESRVRLRIGLAYLLGGEHRTAEEILGRESSSLQGDGFLLAKYGQCVALYSAADYGSAAGYAKSLVSLAPPRSDELAWLVPKARLLEAWSYIYANQMDQAIDALRATSLDAVGERQKENLLKGLLDLQSGEGEKSAALAGFLSIVPGLGHAYLRQYDVALFALGLNGLFGYAAVESFQEASYGPAIVLVLFEALWYSGAIFGAVSGAHEYNRDLRANRLERLEDLYAPDLGLGLLEAATGQGRLKE